MVKAGNLGVKISLAAICFVLLFVGSVHAQTQASASISVSSSAGIVGSKITVSGSGYPPSTTLQLEWNSANANWVVASVPGAAGQSPPQVTGINVVPFEKTLGSAQTNASGSFSVQITTPSDFGVQHVIQAYAANGTAYAPKATYTTEPLFTVSPLSGPAGTPITITGTGLGDGLYSTSYHVYWDNNYVGYATAIDSQGSTSFTVYASGVPGTHFLAIYQGYPGPGYLNAEQIPVASQSQSYFPPGCVVMVSCTIPYYVNFTVSASDPPSSRHQRLGSSGSMAFVPLLAATTALAGGALYVSKQDPERRKAVSRSMAAIVLIVVIVVAGVALYGSMASSGSRSASTVTATTTVTATPTTSATSTTPISFTPVASIDRPQITVPVYNTATTGPRITVTPEIVSVGQTINVTGQGFAPNTQLPITWSTRQGSNLLGYKLVALPLKTVTTDSNGAFTFAQKVHSDVGGIHFVAAGNLTENSNGTVFLQRTGTISATQGPARDQDSDLLRRDRMGLQHEHHDRRLRQLVRRLWVRLQHWR